MIARSVLLLSCVRLFVNAFIGNYEAREQYMHGLKVKEVEKLNEIRVYMFPPITKKLASYSFNNDAVYFPDEIWVHICELMGGAELWRMNVTSKKLRSLIRPQMFDALFKSSPNLRMELLNILVESELNVKYEYVQLLREGQDEAPFVLRAVERLDPDSRPAGFELSIVAKEIPVMESLVPRAIDIKTLQGLKNTSYSRHEVDCNLTGLKDVYESYDVETKNCNKLNYFPKPDGLRLLQRVNPTVVYHSLSTTNERFKRMFLPCIIIDYILPLWHLGERSTFPQNPHASSAEITSAADEMKSLRTIFELYRDDWKEYFEYLHWALYLQTGTTRKTDKTIIGPISRFLESLGLAWKSTQPGQHSADYYGRRSNHSRHRDKYMLAVAHQWGLDLKKIVSVLEKGPSEICEQILAGVIPDIIVELAAETPEAVHYIMYGYMKFGKFETSGGAQEEVKGQKRERYPPGVTKEVKEPSAKKQKFSHAHESDEDRVIEQFSFEALGYTFDRFLADLMCQFKGNEDLAAIYGANYFQALSERYQAQPKI